MRTCGFENQINLYLDGELSGEKLRSFEAHLEDCPECRIEVEQYRGLLNELGGLKEREVPPMLVARLHDALAKETEKGDGRVKRKFNPWALSAVAAAVVVLIGGITLLGGGGGGFLHNNSASYDLLQRQNTAQGAPEFMPAATEAPATPAWGGDTASKGLPVPAPTVMATMASQALTDRGAKGESLTSTGSGYSGEKPADTTNAADNSSNPPQQTNGRKIIYTAYVVVETMDYNARLTTVEGLCARYGGYKASSQENGKPEASNQSEARSAVFSLRIPIDKYDSAMADLKAMGNDVISNQETTDDVSRQYVDTDARNKTLKDERDKLEELLAKATDMDSIIALQNQITELTTEIEQQTAQLNFWDDQVSYSTITVELHELVTPKSVTPADPDLNTRVNGAFYSTLNNMKKGFENFEVGFVGFLPWLAVIVVLAGVAVAVVVPAARRSAKAARQRAEEEAKAEAEARAEAGTGSAKKEE